MCSSAKAEQNETREKKKTKQIKFVVHNPISSLLFVLL